MAPTKNITKKKLGVKTKETADEVAEIDSITPKIKTKPDPIELDDAEPLVGVEEKIVEEDPLNPIETEDEELSEVGIDSEELNPFGDRWEE
jgi:hypothetical protein